MSIFRKRAISEQQAQTLAMTEVVTKALQQSFAAQGQQNPIKAQHPPDAVGHDTGEPSTLALPLLKTRRPDE